MAPFPTANKHETALVLHKLTRAQEKIAKQKTPRAWRWGRLGITHTAVTLGVAGGFQQVSNSAVRPQGRESLCMCWFCRFPTFFAPQTRTPYCFPYSLRVISPIVGQNLQTIQIVNPATSCGRSGNWTLGRFVMMGGVKLNVTFFYLFPKHDPNLSPGGLSPQNCGCGNSLKGA